MVRRNMFSVVKSLYVNLVLIVDTKIMPNTRMATYNAMFGGTLEV